MEKKDSKPLKIRKYILKMPFLFFLASLCLVVPPFQYVKSVLADTDTELPEEETNKNYPVYNGFSYRIWTYKERTMAGIIQYVGTETEVVVPSEIEGYPVVSGADRLFRKGEHIKSITLPKTMTTLYQDDDYSNPFFGCTSLEEIKVEEGNPVFFSKDGVLYQRNSENPEQFSLVCYPAAKKGKSYDILKGTTSIWSFAFDQCRYVEKVTVPEGVTSLFCWFHGCKGIRVELPNSIKDYPIEGHAWEFGLFQKCEGCYAVIERGAAVQVHFDETDTPYIFRSEENKDKTNGSFLVRVARNDLRIRNGAGLKYRYTRLCPKGTYTIVETRQADGYKWGRLKSGAGWIVLDYTKLK